ncbi:MAG TPA: CocE/NonD family hydrolase [Gemmatimonadaceae bacterium]
MILLLLSLLLGSMPTVHNVSSYERRELTIPMRDGTRLFAVALAPTQQTKPLPIMLIRTPFDASRELRSVELPLYLRELAEDGYIFVVEDIRGRGKSEGTFITLRAQNDPRNSKGTNESTDAYDTIDWLVKNLPNNSGRVGVMGVSYRGWLAALAAVGAHPAVKAISPQAPITDAWLGDDFFHQGAFRQTQGLLYSAYIEGDGDLEIPVYDQYTFYSRFPTLDSLARATKVAALPSWMGFREHPAWDSYWQSKALQNVLTSTTLPMLFVGGFWDEEDILGPQLMYRTLEKSDASRLNHIVLGPWFHNTWITAGGDSLGPIALGSNTSKYFREHIQRPWFAHYLHGDDAKPFPEAHVFETGANEWRSFDAWPPKNVKARNIYLRENGKLSFDSPSPAGAAQFDQYVSDPAHPVPNAPRPDDGSGAHWMQIDQRFVDGRPDVVTWQTEPLTEDVIIAGDVTAHLFASTTGTDADWVVKLIDVYPDTVSGTPSLGGYELIVNADVMRGRYWKSFSRAAPIPANTVTRFNVDMHQQLYRFKKGHRLMVQVQSTWFPLYDRNPQTFVPNIFNARAGDYRAATHRVWHTVKYPSHVTVQVLTN